MCITESIIRFFHTNTNSPSTPPRLVRQNAVIICTKCKKNTTDYEVSIIKLCSNCRKVR
jgi:uncharacterized CHY-type Zn-finger protein